MDDIDDTINGGKECEVDEPECANDPVDEPIPTGADGMGFSPSPEEAAEQEVVFTDDGNPYQKIWTDTDEGSALVGAVPADNPFSHMLLSYELDEFPGFKEFVEIHGTPIEDIALMDPQDDPNSCAVATVNMLFRSIGFDPGEDLIAEIFTEYGIYHPASGTYPDQIDEVVNAISKSAGLDIEATEINGFDIENLQRLLDNGVRPLVGVDAYELHADGLSIIKEILEIPGAGHAVQVTGIIRSTNGDFVMINDPGFEGGADQKIPIERFMNAAGDFGFKAITITRT